jgi:hypothetical protein
MHEPVGQTFAGRLDAGFVPTFILLDGEGNEVWRGVGSIDRVAVLQQVEALD